MEKEIHENAKAEIESCYKMIQERKGDYDKTCRKVAKMNKLYIDEFKKYLANGKRLSKSTVTKQVRCVSFFANAYLTHDFQYDIYHGMDSFSDYFGYFFVRKNICGSVTSMKEHIAALKKFYRFMAASDYIDKEALARSERTIKICKDEWIEEMYRYDQYLRTGAFEDMSFEDFLAEVEEFNEE